ncbi:MAG: hypothetical protein PHI83_02250 [Sphaerochaetaceae bacterium]|nr:hypothetical protein [Sphaerochaetaceae bacterium]
MSKAHRGTGIRKEKNHARGTCPVCSREAVKLLYEAQVDGVAKKVCKQCSAKIKNA